MGTTYVLGFYATSDNQDPNGITLSATGLANPLVLTDFNSTSPLVLYVECSVTFTASSTTTSISLIGGDIPGYLYADDVYMYACQ